MPAPSFVPHASLHRPLRTSARATTDFIAPAACRRAHPKTNHNNPGGTTIISRPFLAFLLALAVLGAVEMTADGTAVRAGALVAIASVPFIAAGVLRRELRVVRAHSTA